MSLRISKIEMCSKNGGAGNKPYIGLQQKQQQQQGFLTPSSPTKKFYQKYNSSSLKDHQDEIIGSSRKAAAATPTLKHVNNFEDLVTAYCEANNTKNEKILYKNKYIVDLTRKNRGIVDEEAKKSTEIPIIRTAKENDENFCMSTRLKQKLKQFEVPAVVSDVKQQQQQQTVNTISSIETFKNEEYTDDYYISHEFSKKTVMSSTQKNIVRQGILNTSPFWTAESSSSLNKSKITKKVRILEEQEETSSSSSSTSQQQHHLNHKTFAKELKLHPLIRGNRYLNQIRQ